MAGTLTITTPATDSAAGYSTSSIGIVWSFAGTSGATQTQRRVVATPVGSGTATFDTGLAASTATTATVTGLATGVSYNVDVSVVDTAGATTTARRVVVSNYTRPLPPTFTIDASDEAGPVLTITNPTDGSRPAVTTNAVYRRLTVGGSTWTLVGSTGNNGTFQDITAQARTGYTYFVRANGQVDSATAAVTTPDMTGAWMHEAGDPSTLQHYPFATAATETVDLEGAFHAFVGRQYAVQETGVARTDVLAAAVRVMPWERQAAEEVWRGWKRRAPSLVYRDGRSRSWVVGIDGPVTLNPDADGATIAATLRRVDSATTTLAAGAYNYLTNVDGGKGTGGSGSTGKGL